MAGGLGVQADMSSFNAQVRDLAKRFPAATKRNLRAAVAESGAELVAEMRNRSSWSNRIPGAIELTSTFGPKNSRARIKVDAKQAPHARGLEMGNRNSFNEAEIAKRGGYKTVGYKDRRGNERVRRVAVDRTVYRAMKTSKVGVGRSLSHPVYGHGDPMKWGWAVMPTRPFFFAAVEAREPGIERKFEAALTQIVTESGFKGA